MRNFDHFDLSGHTLRLFLTVLDKGSVTVAAHELGLTQSAVSHALQKLRAVARDPLFVKSGRGIVATAHAHSLAGHARDLLAGMQDFSRGARFDPRTADLALVVAANDLQRDLLMPGFALALEREVRKFELRIIPSDSPGADILRKNVCDLLITPYPPEGADIFQRNLFRDEYVCFYDPACRTAPASRTAYLAARHVTVVYPDRTPLAFDAAMDKAGLRRDFAVSVASFSGVAAFLRGTQRLATLPRLLGPGLMHGLACCPVPGLPRISGRPRAGAAANAISMSLVWRRRDTADPAMTFVRNLLFRHAAAIVRAARRKP
ncbi:MAG: LysR family transcriptional regulator [Rhodoblastus sp.]